MTTNTILESISDSLTQKYPTTKESKSLSTHIPDYKKYLENQSKSPNTIKSYVSEVLEYFKSHKTISRSTVLQYKRTLLTQAITPTTQNHKLSSLKSFNEYLHQKKLVDSIYIIQNDFIKIQSKGNPTEITDEQISTFLESVKNTPSPNRIRNIAITQLMANTGIRREEVCNLTLKGINLQELEMTFIGKGNKQRTVYLLEDLVPIMEEYLEDRKKYSHAHISPYLFLSKRGNKLQVNAINVLFEKYNDGNSSITPHQLRHHFATSALEQEIYTLAELKDQLGHATINNTGIYAHARKSSMKKKINGLRI